MNRCHFCGAEDVELTELAVGDGRSVLLCEICDCNPDAAPGQYVPDEPEVPLVREGA